MKSLWLSEKMMTFPRLSFSIGLHEAGLGTVINPRNLLHKTGNTSRSQQRKWKYLLLLCLSYFVSVLSNRVSLKKSITAIHLSKNVIWRSGMLSLWMRGAEKKSSGYFGTHLRILPCLFTVMKDKLYVKALNAVF